MAEARERIEGVARKWFISEPALFAVYCKHDLCSNTLTRCAFRSGQGRVEYNPDIVNTLSDPELEQRMRVEIIRLCLRHPYERQPLGCSQRALHMGSDMVIAPAYDLRLVNLTHPKEFNLPEGQHFEWYVDAISDKQKELMQEVADSADQKQDGLENNNGSSDGNSAKGDREQNTEKTDHGNGDNVQQGQQPGEPQSGNTGGNGQHSGNPEESAEDTESGEGGESSLEQDPTAAQLMGRDDEYSGLWREDEERMVQLKETLEGITQWGSIPAKMVATIQRALEGRIDYRKVLRAFQTSVISTNRNLTRMRPNRRFGFDAMGSKHDMSSRLLVAVDVSGSVSDKALGKFFRIISNFFKYGVEEIDVIQFDAAVSSNVTSLKQGCAALRQKNIDICGRGGTNFQCVVNYLRDHNNYDGLIIFTDGYAPEPRIDFTTRAKLLWVTETKEQYDMGKGWMRKLGRACFIM